MPRRRCTIKEFADLAIKTYGRLTLDRAEATQLSHTYGILIPFVLDKHTRVNGQRGIYQIPVPTDYKTPVKETVVEREPMTVNAMQSVDNVVAFPEVKQNVTEKYLPQHDEGFVEWGNFDDIYKIIKQGLFYTVYITGLSGNGKTMNIEEACYKAGREFIRANITNETDEDDLIGGFRLINGDTVWQDGPVIEAMQRGAILLLDEVDLASVKIMCLQPVLEGKGIFVKKISKWVRPAPGFNVFATANTKGKGSDSGHFVGTTVLNEAFLDRFAATMFQDYPDKKTEINILKEASIKAFAGTTVRGVTDPDSIALFIENLVNWANVIRETHKNDGIQEVISTRRLVNIINAYFIFIDEAKAIGMSIERFDAETRDAMIELYNMQKKK